MVSRIKRNFFLKPTLEVSKNLLGKYLIHQIGHKKIIGKIVETEAYIGPKDMASHAKKGKITPRNLAVYMKGGHIYIYLVYGMYWQLNFSTGQENQPECVLIRALEPFIKNLSTKNQKLKIKNLANGPGKLCRYMKLDKRYYGLDLVTSQKIWLEERKPISKLKIIATKRINIDYAGKYWANRKWRFYISGNPYISKR